MSSITIGLIGLAVMLVLLFLRVPVGIGMTMVGFLGILILVGIKGATLNLATIPFSLVSNYTYCVIPLFFLMANICSETGMGAKLFNLVYKWIGKIKGGLLIAAVFASALFGAVSSSATATSLTIGKVTLREVKQYGYDESLSAACVSAGGTLGTLIPPSGIFILYGILTEQSIGKLFISGIVPGILLAVLFAIMILVMAMKNPQIAPKGPSFTWKERFKALGGCIEFILLIILVIGGLMVGWFTPTEAGGIGAFGAIIISLIRGYLKWDIFVSSVRETIKGVGAIYLLLIGAFVFNAFLALSTIPMELADIVRGFNLPAPLVIIAIVIIYLVLGCFIDSMAMILLTVPTFYPVVLALGYDPIWFGTIIVLVVGMGSITPPVGLNVYVISGVAPDIPIGSIFKNTTPFLICEFVLALIFIIFPGIITFLPNLVN